MLTKHNKLPLSRWTLAAAAILLVGTSCTAGVNNPPSADATPAVDCDRFTEPASVILGGGGATGFLPLNDGENMELIFGLQNLWMVTPSIRADHLHPGEGGSREKPNDPMVVIETYLGVDRIGAFQERRGMNQTVNGAELLSLFVPFDDTWDVEDYEDQIVTLRATVTDACGRVATDELMVAPHR